MKLVYTECMWMIIIMVDNQTKLDQVNLIRSHHVAMDMGRAATSGPQVIRAVMLEVGRGPHHATQCLFTSTARVELMHNHLVARA